MTRPDLSIGHGRTPALRPAGLKSTNTPAGAASIALLRNSAVASKPGKATRDCVTCSATSGSDGDEICNRAEPGSGDDASHRPLGRNLQRNMAFDDIRRRNVSSRRRGGAVRDRRAHANHDADHRQNQCELPATATHISERPCRSLRWHRLAEQFSGKLSQADVIDLQHDHATRIPKFSAIEADKRRRRAPFSGHR